MKPINALVARVRDHYVDQFKVFADEQRRGSKRSAAEVKIELSDTSDLFQRLYCVDFIQNDTEPQIVELNPDFLSFDPIVGSFGTAEMSIMHLRWDDVSIRHDLTDLPADIVSAWFEQWFDPEDRRYVKGAPVGNIIHSLLVEPNLLHVDFGTAEPDALWELLDILQQGGATKIQVTASRAEAEGSVATA